ncbi:transcriptional regulator GcvA [Bosea sp. (in: a-proteobacteria)]|uniref:transcriptional regulator GcvA n=1 Tax=Bosea sp. (in: a-proteobacteria) TaxID=1871050 RepID=UPI002617B99B|nr:transcriptional regulator GcvA [Bosea sp. (in: a-proteobacteria)]MCO5089635.1 transcriptional regulator GcvA [Bosea sp. (in: a-proteobacteria)]
MRPDIETRRIDFRLPPLNSARAFEAAARHKSFSLAAAELCVSQGAISRHIIALEKLLDVKLFERLHRRVVLTEAGRSYFFALNEALYQIAIATDRLRGGRAASRLTVMALPTFTARWLMPRLGSFNALHRDIAVEITTANDPFDASRSDFDVAIGYGLGDWSELIADELFGERLVVVSSPRLADGRAPPHHVDDVRDFALLHSINRPGEWRRWLDSVGLFEVSDQGGLRFGSSDLVYQAARSGLGLALAQTPFIGDDLKEGRLVRIFDSQPLTRRSYYLLYPRAKRSWPVVQKFRRWALSEANQWRLENQKALTSEATDRDATKDATQ